MLALVLALLLLLLAAAAHAAPFGTGLKDLPTSSWVLTLVISTLAGALALLNRIREELRVNGALRWGGLFVSAHMLGSWLAGLLVFLLSISLGWSEAATAIAIIAASFGGAVFIEKMAVKWLWRSFGVNMTAREPQEPKDEPLAQQTLPSPPDRRKRPRKATVPGPEPAPRRDFSAATDSAPLDSE